MPVSAPIGPNELVIGDHNYLDHIDPVVDGEVKLCRTVPRDWDRHPHGSLMHAKPFNVEIIQESNWEKMLAAQIAANAQLSKLRRRGKFGGVMPSRDQNGKGYCWAHSSVSAMLLTRAVNNLPFVDLSAFMVACTIKGYRDEGGWGSESIEFIAENGVPSSEHWPQQSMSRSNDTPAMRANAKLHRFTDWLDLDPQQMKAQLVTSLLLGWALVGDFNWWGHSVCISDLVSLNPFRVRIWNSWGDSWSEEGFGVLENSKAMPDSCWALRTLTASAA